MTNTILNDQLTELIFTFSRTMKDEMKFDSDVSQLTMVQFQALIFIKKKKVVSMGDIANQFKITLPTVTVLTDKLVNEGLISRDHSENDRRIVNVSLTEKGESLLNEAMKQRHGKINKVLSYLSTEEKNQLLTILKNLSFNIQKNP